MLKLGITLAVSVFALPALACDEPRTAGYSYSYAAASGVPRSYGYMSYAPAAYYDDDYDGGYYGYGGLGLAVGAGIAQRAYWRNRFDNRVNWRGRGYRAAGIGRVGGGVGRIGGVGRVGRIGRR
jgi:hypothetical protein